MKKHNHFLKKLTAGLLGFVMTLGVGAAGYAASAAETRAESATITLIPNNKNTGASGSSYVTTPTEFTYEGVDWTLDEWNPSSLQIRTNKDAAKDEFCFYTDEFPGAITKVVMTYSALTIASGKENGFLIAPKTTGYTSLSTSGGVSGTWDTNKKVCTYSFSASDGYKAISFYQNGKVASGTNKITSIAVTYEKSSSSKTLSSITLSGSYPTSFPINGTFSHEGMTVTANYESGTPEDVTSKASWSKPDMTTAGTKTVTVTYV